MKIQDFKSIRKKIYQFCAYQERSENQVKEKLKSLGLQNEQQIFDLIQELKTEKFIDEERFVKSFVRGKFRNCKWGKEKILYELNAQNFSSKLVEIALSEIDDEEYFQNLYQLAKKKIQSLYDDKDAYLKTQKYLLQKGYELENIQKILKEIKENGSFTNY